MAIVLRLGLLAFLCLGCTAWGSEPRYIFAVVPQFAPTQVHRDWTPLLDRLEQLTDLRFQLRVYDQIPRFEEELVRGVPDFAFMNPYHMVMAKKAQGYRPLVRNNVPLTGILVVRSDSTLNKLSELEGKTVSFPAPNALGASLYMRALLAEQERVRIKPVYAGNHQNVYRQVLRGDAQAGGGVVATLAKEPEAVRTQLRTLYTTPGMASHPIAAHSRIPDRVGQRIAAALLALRNNPEDAKLLATVQLDQVTPADFTRDYAALAKLKLENYAETPVP